MNNDTGKPKPLTIGMLKQILADAGTTDDCEIFIDSGWIKSVDQTNEVPWVPIYEASPYIRILGVTHQSY